MGGLGDSHYHALSPPSKPCPPPPHKKGMGIKFWQDSYLEYFFIFNASWFLHESIVYKTDSKVVPIIKCTCTVFTDNFRNISTSSTI